VIFLHTRDFESFFGAAVLCWGEIGGIRIETVSIKGNRNVFRSPLRPKKISRARVDSHSLGSLSFISYSMRHDDIRRERRRQRRRRAERSSPIFYGVHFRIVSFFPLTIASPLHPFHHHRRTDRQQQPRQQRQICHARNSRQFFSLLIGSKLPKIYSK